MELHHLTESVKLLLAIHLTQVRIVIIHQLVQTSRTSHKILGLPESNGQTLSYF
jgi:hypothetical protein